MQISLPSPWRKNIAETVVYVDGFAIIWQYFIEICLWQESLNEMYKAGLC